MKTDLKKQAQKLRQQGYSFGEIGLMLKISKSTAGLWSRSEFLSETAKLRLKKLSEDGRNKGVIANKIKLEKIIFDINEKCQVLRNKSYSINDYKLFLALLYWGEGAKTGNRLNFINSDPEMIKLYLYFLRTSFNINEDKLRVWLHLHDYHIKIEMIEYWSKITGIPKNQFSIYNKPHTGINKKPGYKGCLSIRYGDSRILKEVFIIIKRIIKIV